MAAPQRQQAASPKVIEVLDKGRQAVEFRLAGLTFEEIADRLGYADRSSAKKAVDRILMKTIKEPAEEYRALVLGRLEYVIRSDWPKMRAGDYQASRVVLRALQQEANLLGLDAPVKINVGLLVKRMADSYGLSEGERRELHSAVTELLAESRTYASLSE
jgi:hypothetical protein